MKRAETWENWENGRRHCCWVHRDEMSISNLARTEEVRKQLYLRRLWMAERGKSNQYLCCTPHWKVYGLNKQGSYAHDVRHKSWILAELERQQKWLQYRVHGLIEYTWVPLWLENAPRRFNKQEKWFWRPKNCKKQSFILNTLSSFWRH